VSSRRILIVQIGILLACAACVAELALSFPYPSPLIRPLLPAKLRWPTAQVEAWVESGHVRGDFLEFFARDPERVVPQGDNLVSPADGLIQNISVRDGISYFVVGLSFWDVHVVRTPVAGVVTDIAREGYSLFRDLPPEELRAMPFLRGKAAPVQEIVTLRTALGDVKVRLITSYWASRLKTFVRIGQHLEKGERIGRILLGSTVVAEFPGTVSFSVQPGTRVTGGETIIFGERTLP
jgi:phosphatidylserine decarboxylase